MDLKYPHIRLILFSILAIVAIALSINSLRKNIDFSSFDDWLDSQLLLNSSMSISLSVQAWRAYKETKKVKEEEMDRS